MIRIERLDMSQPGFARSLKSLPEDLQEEALQALKQLLGAPLPKRLRFEKLSGYKNPSIYTIHITRNHSHKVSFEIVGTTAILRKAGTHKEIDRAP